MRVAFLFADKSKDGLISKKEFRTLLFNLLWTNKYLTPTSTPPPSTSTTRT
jgi:Ca2+-binding EF-hand superfamily protein